MKVNRITYEKPLSEYDTINAKIDICVELEDGRCYSPSVATYQWIVNQMKEGYVPASTPTIIIKKIEESYIVDAINEYAEYDAWLLRLYSLKYNQEI